MENFYDRRKGFACEKVKSSENEVQTSSMKSYVTIVKCL